MTSRAGERGGSNVPASGLRAVPAGPEIADGLALESGEKHEHNAEQGVEGHGAPQQSPCQGTREDGEIEEEERYLQKHDLSEV